jgi:cob(I)alamin adenosyltransferase
MRCEDHTKQENVTLDTKKANWGKGYIQVYTGDGKGKTTAALGLALRAAGSGLKTYIGQFIKGSDYGELWTLQALKEHIHIEQYGGPGFIRGHEEPPYEEIVRAQAGLAKARQAMRSEHYDIIVLDEINVAIHFRLLSVGDLMAFIEAKPPKLELICTGRNAPKALIERADLVSEIQEIKHYYQQGVRARVGIEK